MKLKKLSNGNILVLNDDDTFVKQLSPTSTIDFQEARYPINPASVYIAEEDYSIPVSAITKLVKNDVETNAPSNVNDLFLELVNNFFFKASSQGGEGSATTSASDLTSGTLNDARLSSNVALNSTVNSTVIDATTSSSPLWVSNYDSPSALAGAIPPWKDKHVQTDSRIQLVDQVNVPSDSDVYSANRYKPTGKAMKVEIQVGDVAAAANRSEVLARFPGSFSGTSYEKWDDPIGSVRWYGFSVYIPSDFTTDATGVNWLTILQLKGYQGGSPPISIAIKRSNFRLDGTRGANSGNIPNDGTIGPITKGAWHRIVFGVKLSTTNNGWVEAWFNGVNTIPRVTGIITSDIVSTKIDPIYLKQGIYRATAWSVPHTVYFGPTKIGDTRAAVMNPKIDVSSEEVLTVLNKIPSAQTIFTSIGGVGDGTTDNTASLTAALGSNRTIFFPKGTYLFNNFITLSGYSNLTLLGERGTLFTTPLNKIFTISGSYSDFSIRGIDFASTRNSTVEDPEGLLFFANYGSNDQVKRVSVIDCGFTTPNTKVNGIKLVCEVGTSLFDGFTVKDSRFVSIGRMGVETQNHNDDVVGLRIINVDVSNNYFNDVGTIQSGSAPACISISGQTNMVKTNFNTMVDMRMDTSTNTYYGIENAGATNMESIGNIFRSSATSYGFTAFIGSSPDDAAVTAGNPRKRAWTIKGNLIDLQGTTVDKAKIRGMEINNLDDSIISENTITTDGIGIRVTNSKKLRVFDNFIKSISDRPVYYTGASTGNITSNNTLWTTKSGDSTCLIYDGSTTALNFTGFNMMIKADGTPGDIALANSAPSNNRLFTSGAEPLRLSAANFQTALWILGSGGRTEFGQNGRTMSIYTNADGGTLGNWDVNAAIANFSTQVQAGNFKVSSIQSAPASATASGFAGEIRFTSDYIYVCVANSTWKRSALTTW